MAQPASKPCDQHRDFCSSNVECSIFRRRSQKTSTTHPVTSTEIFLSKFRENKIWFLSIFLHRNVERDGFRRRQTCFVFRMRMRYVCSLEEEEEPMLPEFPEFCSVLYVCTVLYAQNS